MPNVDVKPTAEAIMDMAKTLNHCALEMKRIADKMVEYEDITYASQAATAVSNCVSNLRLDLLVTRPLREFLREKKI